MPELPEVEASRLLAGRVAAGRRIVEVRCADDPIVFEGQRPPRFRRALLGRKVIAVHRRGKHLWFELDRRPWLVVHFGMTGGIQAPLSRGVKLRSSGHQDDGVGAWPPRFTRLRLVLDDGGELAIADARRLGRIRLRHDPPAEPPVSLLGFDALRELPSRARFQALLRERSARMKALLLDQSFAAGVGNWIADEVLYQAGIDPRRRAGSLTGVEARRVRAALGRVVTTAVRAGSDSDRYPRTWLFHHRWGRARESLTARGERIRHDTIGGRTTAWVPSVQR
jgi:formamidopyrimidine-DNA glycosylase